MFVCILGVCCLFLFLFLYGPTFASEIKIDDDDDDELFNKTLPTQTALYSIFTLTKLNYIVILHNNFTVFHCC